MKECLRGGAWVTMVTPFRNGKIDDAAAKNLVEWYLDHKVDGIFAVCQSSEMFYLSLEERVALAELVVKQVAGRVPVVVSGHISDGEKEQEEELRRLSQTGADAVVMVTNRLAAQQEPDEIWKTRLLRLLEKIPDTEFGLYECPYPYKRLLTPELMRFCAETGRVGFLKDTCCDAAQIKLRLEAVKSSNFRLFNANTATLLSSMRDGAAGYCGVMANFHPELYHWLTHNWKETPEQAELVQAWATVAAWAELKQYPRSAKYHLGMCGVPMTLECRSLPPDGWGTLQETEIRALLELWERQRKELLS